MLSPGFPCQHSLGIVPSEFSRKLSSFFIFRANRPAHLKRLLSLCLQQNPNTANIPLILVTGSELDIAEVKKKYGALIRVVAKPFSVSDLINTVKKSLGMIEARRQAGPDWEPPQDAGCYGSTHSF